MKTLRRAVVVGLIGAVMLSTAPLWTEAQAPKAPAAPAVVAKPGDGPPRALFFRAAGTAGRSQAQVATPMIAMDARLRLHFLQGGAPGAPRMASNAVGLYATFGPAQLEIPGKGGVILMFPTEVTAGYAQFDGSNRNAYVIFDLETAVPRRFLLDIAVTPNPGPAYVFEVAISGTGLPQTTAQSFTLQAVQPGGPPPMHLPVLLDATTPGNYGFAIRSASGYWGFRSIEVTTLQ